MSLFKAIWRFIHTGGRVFSETTYGDYIADSPYIEQFRKDLEKSSKISGPAIDRENLRGDSRRIRQDMRKIFNQHKKSHCYE